MSEPLAGDQPIQRQTLADQVAARVTDRILSGELAPGEALPTEPELALEYGVSRSAVRDATRLLLARGLVQVRHGKGVFVTTSQKGPFADALLLALRRDGATAWDVDEFLNRLVVIAVSLATTNASDEEIEQIAAHSDAFLEALAASNDVEDEEAFAQAAEVIERLSESFHTALVEATHNKVLQHVMHPLLALTRLKEWDLSRVAGEVDLPHPQEVDRRFHEKVLACLRSRNPARAEAELAGLVKLPQQAIDALQRTPVGERARIVITSLTENTNSNPLQER